MSDGDDKLIGMEVRVAKLESDTENVKVTLHELRLDVRELRSKVDQNFLILAGMNIAAVLGLTGILAKGFHWIGG